MRDEEEGRAGEKVEVVVVLVDLSLSEFITRD